MQRHPNELRALAVGTETQTHRREFSQEQLDSMREKLTEIVIQQDDTLEQFQEIRRQWKVTLKEIAEQKKELLKSIRLRYKEEQRECYMIPDQERNMMEFYDQQSGELIFSRRLRPEEKQTNIIHAIAANGQ